MATLTYIDASLSAAVSAATTWTDACAAIQAAFAGDVTVKGYSAAGTALFVLTCPAWTLDAASSPYKLKITSRTARTHLANGTLASLRFFDGATERFRMVGSAAQAISVDAKEKPTITITAPAGLPAGATSGLTAGDLTLLGRFLVPATASGVDMTGANAAMCMGTEGASPTLFVAGKRAGAYAYSQPTGVAIAEIAVPAVLSTSTDVTALPVATAVQATADALEGQELQVVPDSAYYASATHYKIEYLTELWVTGLLKVGSDLFVNQAIWYSGGAITLERACHFKRPANLTTTGSVAGPYALTGIGPRQSPGAMAKIPASLQTSYGWKPAVTAGTTGLSNNQDINNGPGFITFDPADFTGAALASKPAQVLALYTYPGHTFAEANGGIFPGTLTGATGEHNGFWEMPYHLRGGIQIIEHRHVAIFLGFKGTTAPWYGFGNSPPAWGVADPSNPTGDAPHGYPYADYIQVINLDKFRAVQLGSTAANAVTGDNQITLPAPPWTVPNTSGGGTSAAPTQGCMINGSAYDPTTKRLYVSHNGPGGATGAGNKTIISVFQVAA